MNKTTLYKNRKSHNFFVFIKNNEKKIKNIIILSFLFITFVFKNIRKKNIKICLCAIVKNENPYLREFVEYYKKLGYNKIILYDNNEKNGENLEEVIKDYILKDFVQIFDFRGRKKKPQFQAFKDCYQMNSKYYDWLSFFDIDEFLEIDKKYKTIQDFLNDKIFQSCKSIKINWLLYKNDISLYYDKKNIQERIKYPDYNSPANFHIKSTVRGNLTINYWKGMRNPHSSSLNYSSCSSSGKNIRFNSPFNAPPDYTNAKLRHYYYKSFEEYLLKRYRGRADMTENSYDKIRRDFYKELISQNIHNKEKLNIINKIFNKSNSNF